MSLSIDASDPTKQTPPAFAYRPDIDGLRAVAVAAVLIYHAGLALPGGFVGVDIFFVISGFLITGLITRRSDADTFTYTDFWYRRAKRILPAQFAVAFAVLIVGWFVFDPPAYANVAETSAYQAVFASNVYFWRHLGYFAPRAEWNPLLHYWSLAVEEQFYFVMPIVLIPLWVWSKRWAKTALVAGFVLSLALSIVFTPWKANAAFYLLPTRAWEMILGGLLALSVVPSPTSKGVRETLAWVGAALIAGSLVLIDKSVPFPGSVALVPCLGTAAIIAANQHGRTVVGRLLAWRPMVWIGLISYSLYLWHWPVLVFANKMFDTSSAARAALLVLTVPIAWLSWRFIESPFREQRLLRGRGRLFAAAGFGIVASFLVSVLIVQAKGVPERYSETGQRVFSYLERERQQRLPAVDRGRLLKGDAIRIGETRDPSQRPDFILWGDSHAENLVPVLRSIANDRQLYGFVIFRHGTIPAAGVEQLPGKLTRDYAEAAIRFVLDRKPRRVIITAKWAAWIRSDLAIEGNEIEQQSDATPLEIMMRALGETIDRLRAEDATVYVVGQVPTHRDQTPSHLVELLERDVAAADLQGVERTTHRAHQKLASELLSTLPRAARVHLLDPTPYMFDGDRGIIAVDNLPTYLDTNHLSSAGSHLLRPLIEPIFDRTTDSNPVEPDLKRHDSTKPAP